MSLQVMEEKPIQSMKDARNNNNWANFTRFNNEEIPFYIYDTYVSDAIYELKVPSTYNEIKNKVKSLMISNKQSVPVDDTLERRIFEVLTLRLNRKRLERKNNKYWFPSGKIDKENWNTSSKNFPKKANKIAYTQVYENPDLTLTEKEKITFELHKKVMEKFAVAKTLYIIAKKLSEKNSDVELDPKLMSLNYKLQEQFLEMYISNIENAGFLKQFYQHLNRLDLNDEESCNNVNKMVSQLYKKITEI
jgi:hypothetical protein